nr:unnamed protein product [Callosobruchus analis]
MTPFRNPNNALERAYNRLFKEERIIIERCLGQLKRRLPFLKYMCRVKLEQKFYSSLFVVWCFTILPNIWEMLIFNIIQNQTTIIKTVVTTK